MFRRRSAPTSNLEDRRRHEREGTALCDTRRAPKRSTIAAFEKFAIAIPTATQANTSGNHRCAHRRLSAMICSLLLR
jgi:hypothetical protein